MKFYTYDLETLYNFFSFTGKFEGEDSTYTFEISERKNERDSLLSHLSYLQQQGVIMVGFNSLGFDYPILHQLLMQPYTFDYTKAYQLCQDIITKQTYGSAGNFVMRPKDRVIQQLDLVKINHFDNKAKRTPLKSLQFAMRSESVEDMPVPLGEPIDHEQMDKVIKYNIHDVTETEKFLQFCKPLIEMRQDLIERNVLRGDVLNYSDVKIGTEILVNKIGRHNCYANGKPKQSIRECINFKDVVLPKIQFNNEKYQEVLDWFKSQTIWLSKKGENPKLVKNLAGLDFHFGLGGVHASVNNRHYQSNETHVIKDIDVAGMYVAVAIANKFYPEHLGEAFTEAYKQIKNDRSNYPKGSTMNKGLKLAGNGAYGNSNNPWSPLYDPKYTFTVTSNGQLQLLQLVEMLESVPGLEMIQANTDGITVYMPRSVEPFFNMWSRKWEEMTHLQLEEVEYSRMWIADCNNYIAEEM